MTRLFQLGWEMLQIRELALPRRQLRDPTAVEHANADLLYVGLEHLQSGNPAITAYGQSADLRSTKLLFAPGDVLFGRLRPYLRKVALAHCTGLCSTEILALKPNLARVIAPFLLAVLASDLVIEHAVARSVGTKMPRTTWPALADLYVRVPPLFEQQAIVDILRSVDAVVRYSEAVVRHSERLRSGLLDHMLTTGMGHRHVKKSPLGPIPTAWAVVQLDQVATVRTGFALPRRNLRNPRVVPYLRVANVQDGHLDLDAVKQVTINAGDVERYRLQRGDVLLTEGGDPDKLGRGDVWRGERPECLHQNHVFAVRCQSNLVPEFLSALCRSGYGREYFLRAAKRTTGLASISHAQLSAFPVMLPPLADQERMVAPILSARAHWLAAKKALRSFLRLRRGLSKAVLTDELPLINQLHLGEDEGSPAGGAPALTS